ncbi:MAG: TetR/AcrR family transcriptional regulator [Sporichthyaceae bacterium]
MTVPLEPSAPLRGQAARWAGQRERRRAEFVDAALRVIAEVGPQASVEEMAAAAGVARTRLYRHFTDRADLERAISARVAELIVAELDPLWHPEGSARQMVHAAIGAHVNWLAGNRNLHGFLIRHVRADEDPAVPDGYRGVRRAVADHLTGLFGGYLGMLGVSSPVSTNLAYAVVGMVESVTERWAEAGAPNDTEAVIAQLARWTIACMADALSFVDVDLDFDVPLPPLAALQMFRSGSDVGE